MGDDRDARKRRQFLCNSKDEEAVRSRLFVSNFDLRTSSKDELVSLFAPFGRVYDLAIHSGYAFVQFDNIQSSLQAVSERNNFTYKGRKLLVKLAEKGKKAEVAEREQCKFYSMGNCTRGDNCNYQHGDAKMANFGSGGFRSEPDRPRRESPRHNGPGGRAVPPADRFQDKKRDLLPPSRDDHRFSDRGPDRDRRLSDPFQLSRGERKEQQPLIPNRPERRELDPLLSDRLDRRAADPLIASRPERRSLDPLIADRPDRRDHDPLASSRSLKRSLPDDMDFGRRPRLSDSVTNSRDFPDRNRSRPIDVSRNGPAMPLRPTPGTSHVHKPAMVAPPQVSRPVDVSRNGPGLLVRPTPGTSHVHKPAMVAPPQVGHPNEPRRSLVDSTHRPPVEPRPVANPPGRREAPPTAVIDRRDAPPPVDLRPPYDCVIIAGNEAQRGFCYVIDKKLGEFGMLTNVQVVDGEHLLKRAVEEAARHTVPYTICVTANNEQHRSLTLNILHGVAQEHRNMPLDDAMPFLSRNFDSFVEMMKQKITAVNEWVSPEKKVADLLHLLADGRRLVLDEVLEVDNYVQSVLKKMTAPAIKSGISGPDNRALSGFDPAIPSDRAVANRNAIGFPMDRSGERNRTQAPRPDMGMDRNMSDNRGVALRSGDMSDHSRMIERENSSLLSRPRDEDYQLNRSSDQRDQYSRSEPRPSGGLLGNGTGPGPMNRTANPMLDFESPAVKQALNDLLSARPPANRENTSNRGYMF